MYATCHIILQTLLSMQLFTYEIMSEIIG